MSASQRQSSPSLAFRSCLPHVHQQQCLPFLPAHGASILFWRTTHGNKRAGSVLAFGGGGGGPGDVVCLKSANWWLTAADTRVLKRGTPHGVPCRCSNLNQQGYRFQNVLKIPRGRRFPVSRIGARSCFPRLEKTGDATESSGYDFDWLRCGNQAPSTSQPQNHGLPRTPCLEMGLGDSPKRPQCNQ